MTAKGTYHFAPVSSYHRFMEKPNAYVTFYLLSGYTFFVAVLN